MTALFCAFLLFLAMTLPGLALRPRTDANVFFLAGQSAGTGTVAASLVALCLGASTTIGLIARTYRIGWPAVWWLGAGGIGLLLLSLVWVEPMRSRSATQTLPQWAAAAYGQPARVLAAVLIAVMWTAVIAAQWVAAGKLLTLVFGWSLSTGIGVTALCVVLYTAWGGQRAVLRTDVVQVGMIGAALALTIGLVASRPDISWCALPSPAALWRSDGFAPADLVPLLVVVGGMYIVGPDLCSRILVARDARTARRGAVIAGIALLVCSPVIVGLAMSLRQSGVTQEAVRELITGSSGWFGTAVYLVTFGLLAAMASSADTCLLTAASVLELDVIGRAHGDITRQKSGRALVCAVGACSVLVACFQPSIIPNLLLAYAFYAGGLLVPLLLLAAPGLTSAIPRPAVWTAMVAGGSTPVVLLTTGLVRGMGWAGLCGAGVCAGIMAVALLLVRASRTRAPGA